MPMVNLAAAKTFFDRKERYRGVPSAPAIGYLSAVGDDYSDAMNGTDLLADFRETRSERAFGELVRRYTNFVYSAARRRLADTSLAQEASQLVFIRLAHAAPRLRA